MSIDYFQEASPGMTLERITPGDTMVLEGMHPTKPKLELRLPASPRIEMALDGVGGEVQVRAHTLLIRPHDESFSIVYAAHLPLTRALIPGVYRRFPVTARVDGGPVIECAAPPTARDLAFCSLTSMMHIASRGATGPTRSMLEN